MPRSRCRSRCWRYSAHSPRARLSGSALHAIRPLRPLLALMLALVAVMAVRIALLAYISATSFPASNHLYLSPATPFLLVFVVLGLYLGAMALRAVTTRRR